MDTALRVSALMRRVSLLGGFATLVRRGDDARGDILIQCRERDTVSTWGVEGHGPGLEGERAARFVDLSTRVGTSPAEADAYAARRTNADPDLWIIELEGVEPASVLTA
jgi:hypothetical protein